VAVDLAPGPVGEAAPARPRRRRPVLPRVWHFAGFAGPGLAVYACFVLAPILISVGYSLTNYNPFNPPTRYVGLHNYRLLFTDEAFLTSLKVTTVLTVIVVVTPNVFGLAIAVLLDRRGWLYNALRSVFFVPMVLSSVVVSIVWTRLLDNEGPVNQALRAIGVDHPPGWLSDPDYALYSLGAILSWQLLGFCVVVYLAGLQSIPVELQEAAEMDGAGPGRRFWHVSWPLLAPALTINTVVLMISAFKVFDHVQVITRGGPGEGTTATIAFVVLRTAFEENRGGIASAQAVVMLTIIAVASAVALRLLRRREVEL
jgi:multiple sugar transport system permease protein